MEQYLFSTLNNQKEQDQPFQCIICNTTCRLLNTFVMHMTQIHNKYITVDQVDQVEKQLLALSHDPSTSLKVMKGIPSSKSEGLQTSKEGKSNKPTCNIKGTDGNSLSSKDSGCFLISSGAQSSAPEVLHNMKHQEAQKPTFFCRHCNINFNLLEVFVRHMEQFHKNCVFADPVYSQQIENRIKTTELDFEENTRQLKNSIQCKKKFMYEENLKKHLETHSNQTVKLFNCPRCIKQFQDKPALDMHITEVHTVIKNEDGPISCTYGDKTIQTSVYKIRAPSSAAFPRKIHRVDETLVNTTGDSTKTNSTNATDNGNNCIELVTDAEFSEQDRLHEFERNFVDKKSCPAVSEAVQYLNYEKDQGKPYQCIRCNTTCRLLKTFVMHMAQVHNTYLAVDQVNSLEKELKGTKDKGIKRIEFKCLQTSKENKSCNSYTSIKGKQYSGIKITESEYLQGKKPFSCKQKVKKSVLKKPVLDMQAKNEHSFIKDEDALLLACGSTIVEKEHLEAHTTSEHSDIQKEKCHICQRSFKTKRSLRMHISFIHPKDKPVKCSLCVKQFWEKSDLNRHIRKVHSKVYNEHDLLSCTYCNKKFRTKYDQKNHIRVVHSVKLCSTCGVICKGTKKFYYHVRNYHNEGRCFKGEDVEEEKHKCEFCLRCFRKEFVLKIHEKKHLGEEGRFRCLVCGSTFEENEQLVVHVKSQHSDIINLSSIAYEKKRKRRKRGSDISSKNCQCNHCGAVLSCKQNLNRHLQIYHPSENTEVESCNECGKSYQSRHHLKMHIYTMHTPRNFCVCQVCGRQFPSKTILRQHLLIHTGPQHECGICKKKFRTSNYLKYHQRMHSGVKKLLCPICSKQCAFYSGLKYHMRTHHKKIND